MLVCNRGIDANLLFYTHGLGTACESHWPLHHATTLWKHPGIHGIRTSTPEVYTYNDPLPIEYNMTIPGTLSLLQVGVHSALANKLVGELLAQGLLASQLGPFTVSGCSTCTPEHPKQVYSYCYSCCHSQCFVCQRLSSGSKTNWGQAHVLQRSLTHSWFN